MFKIKSIFFANENTKESTINTFGEFLVISENFPYCPTAQILEFMFSNMAYRATVYSTGSGSKVTAINYVLSG